MVEKTMDKIVALAKSRGFVYPGSEIYGGLANTWDYGNLGVELKNNVKNAMSVSELIKLLKITLTSMVLRLETASTAGAMSRWRILLKRIMFHVRLAVNMISQRSVSST